MRLPVSIVAVAATAILAGGAGVVAANSMFSPSSDVLHQGGSVGHFNPSTFQEGLSIGSFDFLMHSGEQCHEDQDSSSEGSLGLTVRLGDDVSQLIVLSEDDSSASLAGDVCTRVGDATTDAWAGWNFVRGETP